MLNALGFGWTMLTQRPRRLPLKARLSAMPTRELPLRGDVVIHWDEHHIPFIEAAHDDDLAFSLGIVHAHLRLGQLEMLRRVAQGRTAEMGGPLAVDIDHALRILNFGRAVSAIERDLAAETRSWLTNFVHGINHYVDHAPAMPVEYKAFNLRREHWTVADVLTLARLAATDINWLVWFSLLKLRHHPDWPQLWSRLLDTGGASLPSFRKPRRKALLSRLLGGLSRSGSNTFVVSGRRSASGAALIANDPHLTVMLPNLWLIVGYKSPSYHVVGLMLAGLPFVGLGRNPSIAWGGTNMRAASSDLYDVSALGGDEIEERRETIAVRGWFGKTITVRETKWGPVISDAPVLKGSSAAPFALRWLGHEPSDEFTALLRMNRARNWHEFSEAFAGFSVSGQNMLYADVEGNIGQVLAVRLPVRRRARPPDLVLDPRDPDAAWDGVIGPAELPTSFNPPGGYLVSANNRPVDANVPISFFFAPDDRVERLSELLARPRRFDLADLEAIQRDVHMGSAARLAALLVNKIEGFGLNDDEASETDELITLLKAWDGTYRADSRGALAFELFLHQLIRLFYGRAFADHAAAAYSGVIRVKGLLIEDLDRAEPETLRGVLSEALAHAASRLDAFANWGDMHRLRLSHPLASLPLIGARFRIGDEPVGGSSDTIMKTAHDSTDARHYTRYGANARHVSDLADMDENYFVLLGGQDGWLDSSTSADQLPLWLGAMYVRVPLRPATVRATFPYRTVLRARRRERPGGHAARRA